MLDHACTVHRTRKFQFCFVTAVPHRSLPLTHLKKKCYRETIATKIVPIKQFILNNVGTCATCLSSSLLKIERDNIAATE